MGTELERQAVSSDARPAPRTPRTRYGVLAACWLALIIYGSLTPFDFKEGGDPWWIFSPRWDYRLSNDFTPLGFDSALLDFAINLGLYIPLGVLLRLTARRRGWRTSPQIIGCIFTITFASWMIECTQGLTVERIASMKDVCLNTLGGIAGVFSALVLRSLAEAVVFWFYRKTSYGLYRARQFVTIQRGNPLVMFAAVVVDVAIIAFVCVRAIHGVHRGSLGENSGVNWIPFSREVEESYDVAMIQIGRVMVVYLLVAGLLAIQFLTLKRERSVRWMVFGVGAVAAVHELAIWRGVGGGADVTELVVAVVAAGTIIATLFLLRDAVVASCRRRESMSVAVDRRRVPHEYGGR